jgi:glycerol-3-phosphate cytidylyltransferase
MSDVKLYTGGTFDVPHIGHYNFFKQCKKLFPEGHLIVAVNTDEFIERFKGKSPLFSYEERCRFIRMIDYVDNVVRNFGDEDSTKTIDFYKPDIIVIGNDWLEKDYCKQMGFNSQWLRDRNITLCYVPYTEGISTTEIKRRLNAQ